MAHQGSVVAVDGGRGVIQSGQQVFLDIADIGGVLPHTVQHILDVGTVQLQETSGTIAVFKAYWTSLSTRSPRVRHISFSSQPPDLLSWFYVFLSDFGLSGNLIHHLASSGFYS